MGRGLKKNQPKNRNRKTEKRLRREESTQRAFTAAASTQTIGNISSFFCASKIAFTQSAKKLKKKKIREKKTTKKQFLTQKIRFTRN